MKVVVLTPAPDYPEAFGWAYDIEAAVLKRAGIKVEARPWTDPGKLDDFDLILPLVAWGYHLDPPHWHALLDRLDREERRVLNPVALLRWNSDKRYLAELGGKGISVIPTRMTDQLDETGLSQARGKFGPDLVIKPPVSAGAHGTHRLGLHDPAPKESLGHPMMIQPYLPAVAEEGEYSCLLFGGEFSHCLVKRPKAGDYRVQPHLGGTEQPCDPPAGAIELAKQALAMAPAPAAYARVDLVRDDAGELAIIELELIEPSLWLEHAPDGGTKFVSALYSALA